MITINITTPGLPDGHDLTLSFEQIMNGLIEAGAGDQVRVINSLLAHLNDSVTESTEEALKLAYKGFDRKIEILLGKRKCFLLDHRPAVEIDAVLLAAYEQSAVYRCNGGRVIFPKDKTEYNHISKTLLVEEKLYNLKISIGEIRKND